MDHIGARDQSIQGTISPKFKSASLGVGPPFSQVSNRSRADDISLLRKNGILIHLLVSVKPRTRKPSIVIMAGIAGTNLQD
jgi:hypothetical protein